MTRAAALLALAALAACAPDFVPGSALTDLRVLALAPDPPEVGPGEVVTVTPLTYAAPDDPLASEAWSFCPLTLGATAAYRCVDPRCEVPLDAGPGGAVAAEPSALALACLEALGGALPGGAAPGALPASVETVFRYVARSASGRSREAVARVPLFTAGPPANRNLAPVITSVTVGGAPAAAGAVVATAAPGDRLPIAVSIDPASFQTYDDGTGRAVTEQVVVSFYTSAGRFPDGEDRDEGPTARTTLELRELEGEAEAALYVVARDLRGGQAIAGPFRVVIAP